MLIVAYFTASVNIARAQQTCEVFPTWPDAPNQNLIIIPIIEFDLLSLVFAAMPSLKLTSAVPLICSSVFVISSPSQEASCRVHVQ